MKKIIQTSIPIPRGWDAKIQYLINHEQPFALIKYHVSMVGVTEEEHIKYELVLWQTRNDPDATESLTMDKATFDTLVEKYECKLLEKNKEGAIYGVNNLLQEYSRELSNESRVLNTRIKELTRSFTTSKLTKEQHLAIENDIALVREERKKIQRQFLEDFEIKTFNLNLSA